MREDSPKAYAVLGKVVGGWFWALWSTEDTYLERTQNEHAPELWGIESSNAVAMAKVEEFGGTNCQLERSSWRVRQSLSHARKAQGPDRRLVLLPKHGLTESRSASSTMLVSSVAKSHLELIEIERAKRQEARQCESLHVENNICQLLVLIGEKERELEELRRQLGRLSNRRKQLLADEFKINGASWVNDFLAQLEGKEILLRNPALREFVIEQLSHEEVDKEHRGEQD